MEGTKAKRAKLLYLLKIFSELTDDTHGLTLAEIGAELEKYDLSADRKTLYADFQELTDFGFEILSDKGSGTCTYHLSGHTFELSELKVLVDAVQSAKFISGTRSRQLIKKLESLASVHEAKELNRQVYISGRVKTLNESVYYAVDAIHGAISENARVRFRYFNWNVKKEKEFRKSGSFYEVSPWALVWDDEYYYMVGYDDQDRKIKHYRVDKMDRISVLSEKRLGEEAFDAVKDQYAKGLFRMFGGEPTEVRLECLNSLSGVIIDEFGTDIMIIPADNDHFHVTVRVSLSDQFLSWVIALGGGVRILSPDSAVEKMKELIRAQAALYE